MILAVVATPSLVLLISSLVVVVVVTDPVKEAGPGLEDEELTGPVETEADVLCVVTRVVLSAVIRTGAESEEAPHEGYGHQLKDEVVRAGSTPAC